MKTSTLISTVAAALLAGTTIVAAQSDSKQEPKAAPKAQMTPASGQAKDDTKPGTAQKADPAKKNEPAQGGQMPPANRAQGAPAQQGAQPAPSGAVALTAEQKAQIRQSVLQSRDAPKVANPNFTISVGATVPRTVTLVAVPEPLFKINAAWRGHRYFIVGEQIVIVDSNFRIVAVLAV